MAARITISINAIVNTGNTTIYGGINSASGRAALQT